MARNQIAKKGFDEDRREVFFEFANGERLAITLEAVHANNRDRALAHGLLQKIGDSYAGAESVDEAVESARSVIDMVSAGEWTAAREGIGSGGGDLIKALIEVTGRDEDTVRKVVLDMDDDHRKATRAIPAVKAVLLRLSAERAAARAAKADTSDTTGLEALGL